MTAPDRIYINKVYGQHPEDWDFTDGKHLTKKQLSAKVEYIRADLAPTDAAQAREAALQMAVTVVRQALVDAAFNYKHDKALSSAMFKAETHATNAILALIGERT